MKKATGFTLIELTVVLLIMGIIAAIVTLKISGPVSQVKLQDVAERIKRFDVHTRSYARQHGKALRVDVDLSKNCISRWDNAGNQIGQPLKLPSNFSIEKCQVASQQQVRNATLLKYSSQGMTHSKWILVVGLTGELVELENEQNVQKIMESLSRNDAG